MKQTIKSLILGGGEVGLSLKKTLNKRWNKEKVVVYDSKYKNFDELFAGYICKTLHICFPYSKTFESDTVAYIQFLKPELVIIHSTIKVGTTKTIEQKTNVDVVHSPIRGQHPNLSKSILLFTKYVGTEKEDAFKKAKAEMSNFKVEWIKDSNATELGKILSTSYYGVCIALHKEMEKICEHFKVDFDDAVTKFNTTYNKGYGKLRPNVIRPVLTPPAKEGVSGHCVLENALMLREQKENSFLDFILGLGKHTDAIKGKPHLNKTWLCCEYLGKKRTIQDMSKECEISTNEMVEIMQKYNIPI